MIKISGKADRSDTMDLVIFYSLFTELLQTNPFFELFYILAIEKIDVGENKGRKGKKGSKDKWQIRKE